MMSNVLKVAAAVWRNGARVARRGEGDDDLGGRYAVALGVERALDVLEAVADGFAAWEDWAANPDDDFGALMQRALADLRAAVDVEDSGNDSKAGNAVAAIDVPGA